MRRAGTKKKKTSSNYKLSDEMKFCVRFWNLLNLDIHFARFICYRVAPTLCIANPTILNLRYLYKLILDLGSRRFKKISQLQLLFKLQYGIDSCKSHCSQPLLAIHSAQVHTPFCF